MSRRAAKQLLAAAVVRAIAVVALSFPAGVRAAERADEAQKYISLACRDETGRFSPLTCEQDQKKFVGEYQLAFWGEYVGQRNVAFCLRTGCAGALFTNPVQACAWRLVIAGMGHAEYDSSDATNLRFDCEDLAAADLSAAKARSERILAQIVEQPSAKLEEFREKLMNDVYGR